MKKSLFLIVTATALLVIAGCATKTVSTNPTTGVTSTNYQANVAAIQVASAATQAAPVIAAALPQPIGSMVGAFLGVLGLLVGGGASAIAVAQNAKANLHQSTLQAVITGVENAIPSIQGAIGTVTTAGIAPSANPSLATANAVLGAVKQSISAATTANGTQANLNNQLASAGIGPTAS